MRILIVVLVLSLTGCATANYASSALLPVKLANGEDGWTIPGCTDDRDDPACRQKSTTACGGEEFAIVTAHEERKTDTVSAGQLDVGSAVSSSSEWIWTIQCGVINAPSLAQ